ncbi:uncharacterized protein LOC112269254 isoform X2 [Brachypodium distachyon]|uniref:Uncharacterized protein n=2 Tax=Brachypodium distachyon TaxID=15368 RepID=A0A2K2CJJ3_BRADI|nr:uncharacterized protein LOC112269254 isoform X2 [Brachypodium distachyon]PNT62202.1 hypothetical protein BRADI_5g26963v3 [Brachypodium distachyon]|eukprot:XP_024311287.1 uncharacterized protein LOC112269254 isoform X2 [Brachypodium distachyon]
MYVETPCIEMSARAVGDDSPVDGSVEELVTLKKVTWEGSHAPVDGSEMRRVDLEDELDEVMVGEPEDCWVSDGFGYSEDEDEDEDNWLGRYMVVKRTMDESVQSARLHAEVRVLYDAKQIAIDELLGEVGVDGDSVLQAGESACGSPRISSVDGKKVIILFLDDEGGDCDDC